MHYKALTPSPYLAAGDLGGPDFPPEPTFEIVGESFDQLPSMKPGAKADDKETKGLVRLRFAGEIVKPWIANKTNMILIAAMHGEDTDGWRGKPVTLHVVPVRVGPKVEPGIRVKGSPTLTSPKTVEIKFRGRKSETFPLVPTGNRPPPREEDTRSPLRILQDELADLAPADVVTAWADSLEEGKKPTTAAIARGLARAVRNNDKARASLDAFLSPSEQPSQE